MGRLIYTVTPIESDSERAPEPQTRAMSTDNTHVYNHLREVFQVIQLVVT